jgi:two-component system sensor histidine kinase FlrB
VDAAAFHKKIDIQTNAFNPKATILGNETAISGAVSNLLHNAIQASNDNSTIKVVMATVTNDAKPFVSISVVDQGKGIDEAQVSKIFEPFYTSKSQGTGLGLAVVKSVAQSHKGLISARNNANGVGACFELLLPSFQENQNFASAQSHGHSCVVAISNGVSS